MNFYSGLKGPNGMDKQTDRKMEINGIILLYGHLGQLSLPSLWGR